LCTGSWTSSGRRRGSSGDTSSLSQPDGGRSLAIYGAFETYDVGLAPDRVRHVVSVGPRLLRNRAERPRRLDADKTPAGERVGPPGLERLIRAALVGDLIDPVPGCLAVDRGDLLASEEGGVEAEVVVVVLDVEVLEEE
jgi:hypothetical protein